MKILFVQPYLTFSDVFLDALPGHLAKKGHDVEVVCYVRGKKETRLYSKETNIRFHFVDAFSVSMPGLVREFPYFFSLGKIVEEIQPDIIHINNLPFLTTFQSARLAKRIGVPSIVHVHGVMARSNRLLDAAQYFYIDTLGQSVFRDATLIVCLTGEDAQEIHSHGCPLEKIRVIPNGVDVGKFKPCEQVMDDLIFWGGRFVPPKGLEHLVRALHLVVEEKPTVKLVMAGDGPLFSKIHDMVRRFMLEKNVVFKGLVLHDEMPRLIGTTSICVLPSLKEGMPYALLEAMACGKPVIGSNIHGINDVISHGDNGILVPPRNPEALADAILTLMADRDLRRKLGHNARQLMVEKYSWAEISARIEGIYREAMARSGKSP